MNRDDLEKLVTRIKTEKQEQLVDRADEIAEVSEIAQEKRTFLEAQDKVVDATRTLLNDIGVNPSKTTHRAAKSAQASKQAYPGLNNTSRRGLGGVKRTQSFASNYEMRRSNLIHIGTIDSSATDGRTEGYVELIEEEVVLSGKINKSALKGKPHSNLENLSPTGIFSRIGVRIMVGEPGVDVATTSEHDLIEIKAIMVPLISEAQRAPLEALDSLSQPTITPEQEICVIRDAAGARIKPEQVEGIEQMAAMIDIIDDYKAQQAATATPPVAPTLPPPPAAPVS